MKKKKLKNLCFDIDGVIFKKNTSVNKKLKYNNLVPIKKNIKFINDLYKKGYNITLFTARYMGKYNNNRFLAEKKIKKKTIFQLKKCKLNYNNIFFGKPSFDLLIDDQAIFFKKNWIPELKKILLG